MAAVLSRTLHGRLPAYAHGHTPLPLLCTLPSSPPPHPFPLTLLQRNVRARATHGPQDDAANLRVAGPPVPPDPGSCMNTAGHAAQRERLPQRALKAIVGQRKTLVLAFISLRMIQRGSQYSTYDHRSHGNAGASLVPRL